MLVPAKKMKTAGRNTRINPYVIDCHQDHRRTADQVDGPDSGLRGSLDGERGGKEGSAHDFPPSRERLLNVLSQSTYDGFDTLRRNRMYFRWLLQTSKTGLTSKGDTITRA
jgi:hypothetical protein